MSQGRGSAGPTLPATEPTADPLAGARPPEADTHGGPAPRFAYMIMSHKAPRQVEALADRLFALSPRCLVVVHHDTDGADVPWGGTPPRRAHLVARTPVEWGGWSMVEVMLKLVRFSVERLQADWVVLLSGEDRPVVDLARWERQVVRRGVDAIGGAQALPGRLTLGARRPLTPNMFLARCVHRWWAFPQPSTDIAHRAVGLCMRATRAVTPLVRLEYAHRRQAWVLGLWRRRGPVAGVRFYKGSQWIAMSRRAAEVALHTPPEVEAWFRRSWIPDETYLHTVLRHHPGMVVADEQLTYVPRREPDAGAGWMRLTLADLPAVWASGAAFARKVDPAERPEVLAAIDEAVDRQRLAPVSGPVVGEVR